jgi:epothilone polyketide synthase E
VFTDVSDLFLNRAMERFADFPFVQYSRLDIDRDPREQGFPEGSFDVVIAANVLHATRDLGGTIDRVAMLLAEGGILVLSETTAHPRVFDITTGLIEGCGVSTTRARDNPLVSADR